MMTPLGMILARSLRDSRDSTPEKEIGRKPRLLRRILRIEAPDFRFIREPRRNVNMKIIPWLRPDSVDVE